MSAAKPSRYSDALWYTDGVTVWASSAAGPAVCVTRPLGPNEGTMAPIEDQEDRARCAALIAAAPQLKRALADVLATFRSAVGYEVFAEFDGTSRCNPEAHNTGVVDALALLESLGVQPWPR